MLQKAVPETEAQSPVRQDTENDSAQSELEEES